MIAKYHVKYSIPFQHQQQPHDYTTDDPVACEQFLAELLDRNLKIHSILHEGVAMSKTDFDRMIKTAVSIMSARHVAASLDMDLEEVHYRYNLAA